VETLLPVVDFALAEQFYSTTDEKQRAALREMLTDFTAEVAQSFAELHQQCVNADAETVEARRKLHGLRGVMGNYAFQRGAERLRELELQWGALPSIEIKRALREAEADLAAGMHALRERFSYLGS
jgi:hypothetical protein